MSPLSAEQQATRARFLALLRRNDRAAGHDPISTPADPTLGPFPWQAILAGMTICVCLAAYLVGAALA